MEAAWGTLGRDGIRLLLVSDRRHIHPSLRTYQHNLLAHIFKSPVVTLASGMTGCRYVNRPTRNLVLWITNALTEVKIWLLETSVLNHLYCEDSP